MNNRAQTLILSSLAIFIAAVIFVIDINVPLGVAMGATYCIVILYSWLLPGRYTVGFSATICTLLVILGYHYSSDFNQENQLPIVNRIISIIVIWVCAALVALARQSLNSLEEARDDLEKQVEIRTQALTENQKKLINYNNQLESKNSELAQFAYIASHDLQEPLQTITSFTEILSTEYGEHFDDDGKDSLRFINRATIRMQNLVKGLLDYSRIGKKKEKGEVNCNIILAEIKKDIANLIQQSNAILEVDHLPTIIGHELEIRQLFQNLISNGVKFSKPDTRPHIRIASKKENDYWMFVVHDNGIGIEAIHYERVFIIFQRLHSRKKFEGTGIGLSHCRKIVELHGGKIWVKSKIGEGSSFYFTIPD